MLIARDPSTRTAVAVLDKADTQAIHAVLETIMDPDAVLCSDDNAIYRAFSNQFYIVPNPINLSAGIRVVDHERQCLWQPPENLDTPLPWCRNQVSVQSPRMATMH